MNYITLYNIHYNTIEFLEHMWYWRTGWSETLLSGRSLLLQVGRLPDGDKGIDHLREIFHPKAADRCPLFWLVNLLSQKTYPFFLQEINLYMLEIKLYIDVFSLHDGVFFPFDANFAGSTLIESRLTHCQTCYQEHFNHWQFSLKYTTFYCIVFLKKWDKPTFEMQRTCWNGWFFFWTSNNLLHHLGG